MGGGDSNAPGTSAPMKKSKSSDRWLAEHENDEYVRRARADGYRSRASYKLIEINEKFQLLKKGGMVVDLGAAPGGWTQYLIYAGCAEVCCL